MRHACAAAPRPPELPRRNVLRPMGALLCVLALSPAGCAKKEAPKAPAPPAVTVASPTRKTVAVYGEYVGMVDSPQTVDLVARVEGFLKEIHFEEGSEVEKDALMFVIDPDQYRVALQKAQAQLLSAEAALTQAKNVKDIEVDKANVARDEAALVNAQQKYRDAKLAVGANAMARSQLDSAEADLKEAEAVLEASRAKLVQSQSDYPTRVAQAEANVALAKSAVAQADLDLGYTQVRTPVKGRVGLAHVKIGRLVGHGEPTPTLLATVSATDPLYVHFTIGEREMYDLKKLAGGKAMGRSVVGRLAVNLILEDGSLYPHEGKINFVDRSLDPGTGTLKMRAEFPNPDGFLRPGNYAKVRMTLAEKPDALLVTERALGADQGGPFLLVVNEKNVVEQRPVKTGAKMDGMVVIESGLKPDEQVVVNGLQRARPGTVVAPVREPPAAASREEPPLTAAAPPPAGSPQNPGQK